MTNKTVTPVIILQVNRDIGNALTRFKNQRIGIRILSVSMGLHTKTLERLLIEKHKPSYQTLIKIYAHLHNEKDLAKLLKLVPLVVKDEIIRLSPNKVETLIEDQAAIQYLKRNDLALTLYGLCGSGNMSAAMVKKRYGEYGLDCLKKLVAFELLNEAPKGHFHIGQRQIHLDPEILKKLGLNLIEQHFRHENSDMRTENYLGFLTESISEEAYQKLLLMERQHFEEKIKLIDDPKNRGPVRIFSASFIDRIIFN